MTLKPRSVSLELSALRSLNTRIDLSAEDKKHYVNLEKGYHGEVMFDQLTEKLHSGMLVINDLCLDFNNTIFQIDTLIISQYTIYAFEVKNYEGDFNYEADSFKTLSEKEILNPLDQLKRCKILLQQLLRSLGFQLPIEGYVVFINPEFTLYQAPLKAPFIFPTQLHRFMKTLNQKPSKLTDLHRKMADQLISMHKIISPYTKLPTYEYEQLVKGLICSECYSFMIYDGNRKVICKKCGCHEVADSAILRSIEEIKILFPNKKITTDCVFNWCKVIDSKKKIRRILKENYKMVGYGKWGYFE